MWLLEPVIRPRRSADPQPLTTVVIDAGHGGEDHGAEGLRGMESLYTLDTARVLKEKLEAAGWTVIMTRTKDDFVTRPERIIIANQHPDAVFLSIHYNAFTPEKQGLETFVLKPATANQAEAPEDGPEALRTRSVSLATAIHANCLHRLEMKDRGVQGARLDVLAGIHIPGILIEGGFLTNVEDAARIADPNYRDKFAGAIAQGLENYRRALGQKPNVRDPARQPPR